MKDPDKLSIGGKTLSLFIDSEEIKRRVNLLASRLEKDFKGRNPLFLCVLNGAFVFAGDLLRAFHDNCEISFVKLSSYEGENTTGNVKTLIGLNVDIKDRYVIIVEDIVDTGLTMLQLVAQLRSKSPADVRIATLFMKPEKLQHEVNVDYHCFDIPNRFIVGYGLDCDGLYRNLPAIYTMD